MQSFKTMYRMAVMAATLAIVVMGWRLYGPSAAECKTIALRGVEFIESLLQSPGDKGDAKAKPPAPSLTPIAATLPVAASDSPPLFAAQSAVPLERSKMGPLGGESASDGTPVRAGAQSVVPGGEDGRLKALLATLADLNVQEPKLSPWGASGQLFRFCCRATLGQSPQISRHFESVASQPVEAVEQVLAQVSSWRTAESISR